MPYHVNAELLSLECFLGGLNPNPTGLLPR